MKKEEWRMVPGYEGLYMVSNFGKVKSLNYRRTGKEELLSQQINTDGYLFVTLYKNGIGTPISVHILVAQAFIPNPKNLPEVNHKDEDKMNCCVDNLEWTDRKGNCNHGTRNKRIGEKRCIPVAQYTPDLPCELIKVWPSAKEAATVLRKQGIKITQTNICYVCNHKRKTAGGFGWGYWKESQAT